MKIKVAEAEGIVLDWLVAKAEGLTPTLHKNPYGYWVMPNIPGSYSTDWSQGGQLIERENIELKYLGYDNPPYWGAMKFSPSKYERKTAVGPTPLIAAMRCVVASRLGEEVDVPEELL